MKSRNKDRKPHESIIGKIIYGFLLFMPLLAIGVTCITCFWNKEVTADTETAEISYKYESNEVNSAIDLINGHSYTFTLQQAPTQQQYISTASSVYNIPNFTNFKLDADALNNHYIRIDLRSNQIIFRDESYNAILTINFTAITFPYSFDLKLVNYVSSINTDYTNYSKSTYNEIESVNIISTPQDFDVKNIFYYSIDKVQQSPLFNWAENSAIYTGMTATCNTLNITTTFIPLLMTYWLIISVIYILYDIILVILHIFHKKIHQLEDTF